MGLGLMFDIWPNPCIREGQARSGPPLNLNVGLQPNRERLMRLFSKLFGAKRPAPPCPIHPDELDLVRPEDVEWWSGLSFENYQAWEKEDNFFRYMAFKDFVETDGLSSAEAGKKVRHFFSMFYGNLEERAEEKFNLGAADARLPYVLKDRINRAVMSGIIDKQALEQASSFNALVRQLIRSGRI